MPSCSSPRRPLKTRTAGWAIALARRLSVWGVSPNRISLMSLVFALMGALAMLLVAHQDEGSARVGWFLVAAICIQLRLLCNLLDGMVAIEGGLAGPTGAVFNELPDRLADPLLIVPAGYLIGTDWGVALGWLAGLLALLTANIRLLGGAIGLPQDFRGPMAKPHRMAAMTIGLVVAAAAAPWSLDGVVLLATLTVVTLGTAATIVQRTRALLAGLA